MRLKFLAVAAGLMLAALIAGGSQAATIVFQDTISAVGTGSEVDRYAINLGAASDLEINILANDHAFDSLGNPVDVDLFGHGVGSGLRDSWIYLFDASGIVLGWNDDAGGSGRPAADWPIAGLLPATGQDSYLYFSSLNAGKYILAVGAFPLYPTQGGAEYAWSGFNPVAGSGDYQVTLNATADALSAGAAPVPEPGTMILLGSGLASLAGFGRKRFRK